MDLQRLLDLRGGSDYDDRVALTVAVRRAAGETAPG